MNRVRCLLVALIWIAGCTDSSTPVPEDVSPDEPAPETPGPGEARVPVDPAPGTATPLLVDRAASGGIDFLHEPTVTGRCIYPEINGSGVAVIDYDGDGDFDLYLVDGGRHCDTTDGVERPNRLYRNDGNWQWTDVTESSGAGHLGYGMGASAADYDNDGDTDLFITNTGANALLRNNGDGTFTDVSAEAGIDQASCDITLSSTFVDLDRDGDLDLYVANYTPWRPGVDPSCFAATGVRDYCGPRMYDGAVDRVFLNNGDGTFSDITDASGVGQLAGRSMGVVAFDFDADGDEDLYVTNDGEDNYLWVNQGDGTKFVNDSGFLGCAVNRDGVPEASMGVACLDLDRDGDEDLFMTHLVTETHTYYENRGGFFDDRTALRKLGRWSRPDTGFGLAFFDLENDGDRDLFVGNGRVMLEPPYIDPSLPYAERNRLLTCNDDGIYVDRSGEGGDALLHNAMTRGVARADFDGDGLVDLVVTNNRGPIQLLENMNDDGHHWLGVRVRGTTDNRDGIGAVVQLDGSNELVRVRRHASYLSSHEPIVRFGLGDAAGPCAIAIRWPSGMVERFTSLAPDTVHDVVQGQGTAVETDA